MKVGNKINTVDGNGIIIKIETFGTNYSSQWHRYGVKFDTCPNGIDIKLYKDKILFYYPKEVRYI